MKYSLRFSLVVLLFATLGCSQLGGDSQPLTTREKAAGVGTVVGAGVGAGIGSVWGYGVTGGGAGAALGLITGFLIGDHFQELQKKRSDLDRRIQESERELQRLCDEVENYVRTKIPKNELVTVLDNIGLPYSSINNSYSTAGSIGQPLTPSTSFAICP